MIVAGGRIAAPVEGVAEAVQSQPVYVWALTVVAVFGLLVGVADKLGGRIAKVREWMLEHRRTAREQKDAQARAAEDRSLANMRRQIDQLEDSLDGLRSTVDEQRDRHAEDWREWRRERTNWQAMVTSLTGHAWAWRRAHDAAGHPYVPPPSPRTPPEITEYLAPWPADHGPPPT